MKTKKRQLPSDEAIQNKRDKLRDIFEKVASGELEVKKQKETVSDKLILVKDELLLLKGKNIPYPIMAKMIEENLGLKVSEQTLRQFCQVRLGFPKSTRSNKSEKPKTVQKPEQKTGYSASQALSQNQEFE